jgi:transposase
MGMKAYSVDLRERAVAAVQKGRSKQDVADTFGVGLATVKRWVARRKRDPDDDLAPRVPPGQVPSIGPQHAEALTAQLAANPTATAERHARLWNEAHGTGLSQWTLGRAIRALGWTRKKGRWEPPSATRGPGPSTGSG